jgi:hypothetical protein
VAWNLSPASQFLSLKLENLVMPEKPRPREVTPKEKPVRRPDEGDTASAPKDRKRPTRDTRETPAPNPNGNPAETRTPVPPP